jgi:hypothetical protein
MKTESLNALKQVREAKMMVLSKLTDTTISQEEKRILGDVLINLQEQENTLINFTLQDMVDKINATNPALENLIQQMDNISQKLSAISNTIKKISNVLSTLTEITTKALNAGLLG